MTDTPPKINLPKKILGLLFIFGILLYVIWGIVYGVWWDIGMYSILVVLLGFTGVEGNGKNAKKKYAKAGVGFEPEDLIHFGLIPEFVA